MAHGATSREPAVEIGRQGLVDFDPYRPDHVLAAAGDLWARASEEC
jgi:hypothetical protein